MPFPAVGLVDSFNRANETPLAAGWLLIAGCTRAGLLESNTAGPNSPFSEGEDGAYWNVRTYSSPAIAVELRNLPENATRYMTLWACLTSPGTGERSGYRLRTLETSAGKFTFITERMTKAVFTTLTETAGVALAVGDRYALQVSNGLVIAWRKAGAGAWAVVNETADATYSTGYIGIGGRGNRTRFDNAEAAATHEHVLTASQPASPSARRALSRALSRSQGQAASARRVAARQLVVAQSSTGLLARVLARGLTAGQAQSATAQRAPARSLSATAAGVVTMTRVPARHLTAVQPTAGLLAHSVTRTLAVGQAQLAQLAAETYAAPRVVGIASSSVEPKALVGGVAV